MYKAQILVPFLVVFLFSFTSWPFTRLAEGPSFKTEAEAKVRAHQVKSKPKSKTAKPIVMACVTEFPSTSFDIETAGDKLNIQIINHNGPRYMPIYEGLITLEDLASLKESADVMQRLGSEIAIQWKLSGCTVENDLMFQCVGEGIDFELNGLRVHPWALSVTEVNESTVWGPFFHRNLTLYMKIGDKDYRIAMNYGPKECFRPDQAPTRRK